MRRILLLTGFSVFLGCTGADPTGTHSACEQKELEGIFEHDKNTACGCDLAECPQNTICFHHDCCNPAIDGKLPETCGCQESCEAGELCVSYSDARGTTCCDPTQADDRDYCGCTESCRDTEACVPGADGVYTCECDPELAGYWDDNCGCTGEVCAGATDCIGGTCQCNPTNDLSQIDDNNCACNGPCPQGSHCKNGQCRCENDNEIICCAGEDAENCESECAPVTECECKPENHQGDLYNCACEGPCSLGDKCDAGECVCDPLSNLHNPQNCGCQGPCGEDEQCLGGVCEFVCPAWKMFDPTDCACQGPCPHVTEGFGPEMQCVGGSCQCPANMFYCTPSDVEDGVLSAFACRSIDVDWCSNCVGKCSPPQFCVAEDPDNDGKPNGYHCEQ